MSEKTRAVEVMPGKMWITYDSHGNKNGTLTCIDNSYAWLKADGYRAVVGDADGIFEFEEKTTSTRTQQHVFGYPVLDVDTFNHQERENLPCFTKSLSSKIYFAAGYYVILFENNGWTASFCPKLSTLRDREFLGPFKTEHDRDIVHLRKKRES